MNNSDASSPSIAENASRRERLGLTDRSTRLDPATHAVRADLADIELADRVFAPHYARAVAYRLTSDTPLLASTEDDAETRAQLKSGDTLGVLDISGGYAWGKTADGTPGYVPMSVLAR